MVLVSARHHPSSHRHFQSRTAAIAAGGLGAHESGLGHWLPVEAVSPQRALAPAGPRVVNARRRRTRPLCHRLGSACILTTSGAEQRADPSARLALGVSDLLDRPSRHPSVLVVPCGRLDRVCDEVELRYVRRDDRDLIHVRELRVVGLPGGERDPDRACDALDLSLGTRSNRLSRRACVA
eukprot:Amastigsp_a509230_64.p3 type:complete len:181 gc:universal Amastigsp_a509230_64:2198-1656(-)